MFDLIVLMVITLKYYMESQSHEASIIKQFLNYKHYYNAVSKYKLH
jgi:hypothetical protein